MENYKVHIRGDANGDAVRLDSTEKGGGGPRTYRPILVREALDETPDALKLRLKNTTVLAFPGKSLSEIQAYLLFREERDCESKGYELVGLYHEPESDDTAINGLVEVTKVRRHDDNADWRCKDR